MVLWGTTGSKMEISLALVPCVTGVVTAEALGHAFLGGAGTRLHTHSTHRADEGDPHASGGNLAVRV
jgi:hypothetical protein